MQLHGRRTETVSVCGRGCGKAAAAGGAMDYVEAAQLAEDGIYTELSRRSTPPSPCEAIIQRREAFEPFGDTQFEACFKILPCDLIALQQAGWQVGRSSFLLHGFYQYHHLLLAGRQTEALCSVCRDCRIRRNAIWHRPSASRISRLQNGKTTADHLGTIIRRDPRSGRIPYNLQTPRTKSALKCVCSRSRRRNERFPPVSSRNAIQCIRPDRLDHDAVWQTRDHTAFFIDIALMDADLIWAAGA